MEAVAQWDFDATQPDEMSFRKNTKICVINIDEGGWCKAVSNLQSGFVPATYIKLEPNDWYKEPMSRSEAEKLLLQRDPRSGVCFQPDGAFIIRKSESDKNGFALSVKHEETVQHFKILMDSNNKFYIWPNSVFVSINQLVEKYRTENVSGDQKKVIHLKDMKPLYKAMYDFSPANAEEVELKKGEIIVLIAKSDPNWWEGEVGGKKGFFPKNYVKEYK